MSLTDDQKFKVRLYLGWSERFLQTDSALEGALSAIASSAPAVAMIGTLITECERIDTALVDAERRLKATKAGPLELNGGEISQLRDRGRQFVSRIASILGIEVRNDIFAGRQSSRAGVFGPIGGGNSQLMG